MALPRLHGVFLIDPVCDLLRDKGDAGADHLHSFSGRLTSKAGFVGSLLLHIPLIAFL